jgi:hypothetical protein
MAFFARYEINPAGVVPMNDRVEWFEHGRYIIAELTAEGGWEFWEKDGYEIRWFPCPPNRRLVAKANCKL